MKFTFFCSSSSEFHPIISCGVECFFRLFCAEQMHHLVSLATDHLVRDGLVLLCHECLCCADHVAHVTVTGLQTGRHGRVW
jgi:hypothetical protein